MKILYCEDSEEFRKMTIENYLTDHQVTVVSDGREGIEVFDAMSFDLVLLDYEMREVHGPEVVRHIRKRDRKIPVVAVSMSDLLNEKLLALGATLAVPKRHIEDLFTLLPSILRQ
jgi:CheY-like chemotaxis protein